MKNKLYLSALLCLAFVVSNCENEDNSHWEVKLINKSNEDVFLCNRFTYHGKCILESGGTLKRNSSLMYRPFNGKIEKELGKRGVLEFYLVNPSHYNETNVFYDCDSYLLKMIF